MQRLKNFLKRIRASKIYNSKGFKLFKEYIPYVMVVLFVLLSIFLRFRVYFLAVIAFSCLSIKKRRVAILIFSASLAFIAAIIGFKMTYRFQTIQYALGMSSKKYGECQYKNCKCNFFHAYNHYYFGYVANSIETPNIDISELKKKILSLNQNDIKEYSQHFYRTNFSNFESTHFDQSKIYFMQNDTIDDYNFFSYFENNFYVGLDIKYEEYLKTQLRTLHQRFRGSQQPGKIQYVIAIGRYRIEHDSFMENYNDYNAKLKFLLQKTFNNLNNQSGYFVFFDRDEEKIIHLKPEEYQIK